ncbi:hypothetical protein P67b_00064 [Ruegeria phage Tedan]|nr:hypothetical protein P67b_00064 [Ruegeria phage Tedan]
MSSRRLETDESLPGARTIGEIGNYYGNLDVAEHDGAFWWAIENWSGYYWEEIPESLYRELVKYGDERK